MLHFAEYHGNEQVNSLAPHLVRPVTKIASPQYTSSIGRRFAGDAAEDNSLTQSVPTRGAVLNIHLARMVH